MHAEELSCLARSLTPDKDNLLTNILEPYFEKVRNALGAKSDDILKLLDRWLRHSLYEHELTENLDDLCIDVAHFIYLCHFTEEFSQANPSRDLRGVSRANWPVAIRTALTYRTKFKGTQAFENDRTRAEFPGYTNAARAAKQYREFGIQIELINGDLRISDDGYKQILTLVYQAVKELGGINLLPRITNAIHQYYVPRFDRCVIPRQTLSRQHDRDPSYPLGLLHKISRECLDSKGIEEPNNDSIVKTVEMAQDFVALWGVEPYANDGQASLDVDTMFDVLQQAFAFDEAISIRQASFKNVVKLCSACFDASMLEAALGFTHTELSQFFSLINRAAGDEKGCTIIPQIVLYSELGKCGITKSSIEKMLDVFCPATCSESAWKPLSRFRDALYIPDIRTVAECFFTATVRSASSVDGKFDKAVGKAFEEHIHTKLKSHGIKLEHGKYCFQSENGESDGIVETADYIFLLEIKKRDLVPESRFGSTDRLFRDLMHGLFKSQFQAARAENILYRSGCLQLKNGHTIELKGRTIERISLVPFSYGILHYRRIREDALHFLSKIVAGYARGDLNVSKYRDLVKFATLRRHQIEAVRKLDIATSSAPDFRSHLFDYDMLTYLLQGVCDNETFSKKIIDGSNLEFGTFDWWKECQLYEEKFGSNPKYF